MDKLRIVYATKTKHSRMLAEAIGRALHVQPENAADKPAPATRTRCFWWAACTAATACRR